MYISSRITTLRVCKQGSSCLFVEGIDNPIYLRDLVLFTDAFDPEVLIKYKNIKFFCNMVFSFQRQKNKEQTNKKTKTKTQKQQQKKHNPDINPGARHLAIIHGSEK